MSNVLVGRENGSSFSSVRTGLAIVEAQNHSGEPCFFKVPGNNQGDIQAALHIRKMSGRIICFKNDAEPKGSNIHAMSEKMLDEEVLIADGYKVLTRPTLDGLKIIPAKMPEPVIDISEASRLLLIAKAPVSSYASLLSEDDDTVESVDVPQIKALFEHLGYQVDERICSAISSGQVPDDRIVSYRLNAQQEDFINLFLTIPENRVSRLVENAWQIDIFEQYKCVKKPEEEFSVVTESVRSNISPKIR